MMLYGPPQQQQLRRCLTLASPTISLCRRAAAPTLCSCSERVL